MYGEKETVGFTYVYMAIGQRNKPRIGGRNGMRLYVSCFRAIVFHKQFALYRLSIKMIKVSLILIHLLL